MGTSGRCSPLSGEPRRLKLAVKLGMLIVVAGTARLMLLAPSLPAAAQQPPPNPMFAKAVWVGESEGVLKLLAADGSLLLEVSGLQHVQAVAIDGQRATLWVAAGDNLLSYAFDGTQQLAIALPHGSGGRALLAVNTTDGSLWLARDETLRCFSAAGQVLQVVGLRKDVLGLSLDPGEGLLWVASGKSVAAYDAVAGQLVRTLALGHDADVRDVSADAGTKSVWVAQQSGLLHFGADGTLLLTAALRQPVRVATGPNGEVWAASKKSLVHLSGAGQVLGALDPFTKQGEISQLATDPADGSAWAASEHEVAHASAAGQLLRVVEFDPPAKIRSLAIYADLIPPQLQIVSPAAGSYVTARTPTLQVSYGDIGSGVDATSLAFTVAGSALPASCTYGAAGATCTPGAPLPEGPIALTARIRDFAGNVSQPAATTFTIDTIPPVVTITSPAAGLLTNQPQLTVAGAVSKPATVTVNGAAAVVTPGLTFALPITLLEGPNAIVVVATDLAGNQGAASVQVTLDTIPPAAVDPQKVTVTTPAGGSSTVSAGPGSAEPAATVLLTDTGTGATATIVVAADGSFTVAIACRSGDQIQIVLRDGAGNVSTPTTVTVPGSTGGGLPPDPSTVATPIDPTVVTDIAASTVFLYTGPNAIQQGVQPGAVDPFIVAVLRGSVHDRSGQPIPGVAVKVLGRSDLGSTLTRADGMFDLAANGGGLVIIQYDKAGFLTAQRQVRAQWRDYAWLPDVVLVPADATSTVIDTTRPAPQVARGSVVQDRDGSRQATLLFPAGTSAQLVLPGGQTSPLPTLTVRATEYTVGATGPPAMPAPLPPASAYTYAVELSADEAAGNGATVKFSQPVPFYLENFLGFPVGGVVPAGYYDRGNAAWVASDNGLVVKILSITAGLADLDLTGAGAPADAAALAAQGITADERQSLATLYPVGQTLWRIPVRHFSAWDFNWPFHVPPDVVAPPYQDPSLPPGRPPDLSDTCDQPLASSISCENQALGEDVPIVGTPFTLHYHSDRVPGRLAPRSAQILLSGPSPPASLVRIDLEVTIAGRRFEQSFAPAPNLSSTFTWDGFDGYGRQLQGEQLATVTTSYVIKGEYAPPPAGAPAYGNLSPDLTFNLLPARFEISISKSFTTRLGAIDVTSEKLGGWTLSVHHEYDPSTRSVWRGDGSRENAEQIAAETVEYFGGQSLLTPRGGWLSADGSFDLLYADYGYSEIQHVDRNGNAQDLYTSANENIFVRGVARDKFNQLFFVTCDQYLTQTQIRTVLLPGSTTSQVVIATPGCGIFLDFLPDNAGGFYLVNGSVYHLAPDGSLTTVVDSSTIPLFGATSAALAPDGDLFIADSSGGRLYRLDPTGVLKIVAGNGTRGFSGDGGPATDAQLQGPSGVTVAPDGTLWITDAGRLRRIDGAGSIATVGGGGFNPPAIGGNPFDTGMFGPMRIDPNGVVYFVFSPGIWRFGNPFPGFAANDFLLASQDGREVYQFLANGRHLRTVDPVTGTAVYSFIYDASNLVIGIQDRDGRVTQIERDAQGNGVAIVSPDGQRTTLLMGSDGYLQTATNPAGEAVAFTYAPGGLLATQTDPRGFQSTYQYSSDGRLVSDMNAAGGFKHLQRAGGLGFSSVTTTTGAGDTSQFAAQYPAGGGRLRLFTGTDGLIQQFRIAPDGTQSFTSSDGTTMTSTLGPDPRFGLQAAITTSELERMPSGLTVSTSSGRTATLNTAGDPLSLSTLTDTWTLNGNTFTRTFDRSQLRWTLQTPGGRQSIATVNAVGRITSFQAGTLAPVQWGYDSAGRLTSITQGTGADTRSVALTYDPQGRVATLTDPLQQTASLAHDGVGRVTQETLPDGQAAAMSFDATGNALTFTPPGRPAHSFTYNAVGLLSSYTPPALAGGSGGTTYAYDADRRLIGVTRPDGQVVAAGYDGAGRLATISDDRGTTKFAYDPATGKVSSITAPDGGLLSYLYDGSLVTRTAWSGAVVGTVDRTYDANLRVASLSINGGNNVAFQYDGDGLLTQAGGLALVHDAQNGLLTGTSLGVVATSTTYNAFGEPTAASAAVSGTPLYSSQITRDKLGRVIQKVETIGGVAYTYAYTYDLRGRLATVVKDGTTLSTYTYDATGNRLSWTGPTNSRAATYDSQDRLLQYGDLAYAYQANGELASKTQNGQAMSYSYDAFGNLIGVTTPDGIAISYLVDGRNRRIGKRVDGTLVAGYLYRDQVAPVAQLDGSGSVVAVFVYGTRINVPDYMVAAGKTLRIVTDDLGSARLVVDTASGEVLQRLDYDEFGQVVLDTNPGFQPFGFAGGLYDPQTGLVRFGFRDYDPQIGRWTTKDPMGLVSGEPTLYQYASGDPVNSTDMLGLRDCATYRPLADWLCTRIKQLAKQLNVDPLLLLALAATESGWNDQSNGHPGKPPQHAVDLNNPFGVTKAGGNDIHFSSLDAAFAYWAKTFGKDVQGDNGADAFLAGLQKAGYNTANPNYDALFLSDYDQAKWFAQHCNDKCWGH
jgi:RHS repeat-associated protein